MAIIKIISTLFAINILLTTGIVWIDTSEVEAKDSIFSGGGSGTRGDPYVIEDVEDLQAVNNSLSSHYTLKNDINASITRTWNDGAGFEPIGDMIPEQYFRGSLDGKNYTITGLYINRPTTNFVGLFGFINGGVYPGKVMNLNLEDCNVKGGRYVGGLVGYNVGIVSNCSFQGKVSGNDNVGGLVGYNSYSLPARGTIKNCYASVTVSGDMRIGGLLGDNDKSIVTNSYAIGTVDGGVIIGGLVGSNYYGMVSNCYAEVNVSGNSNVGGLVGGNLMSTISNCFSIGNVKGNNSIGGLVGYNSYGGPIINSHYNIDDVLINGENLISIGGLFDDQYRDWISSGFSLDISDYDENLVPSGEYFGIRSVQSLKDLMGFACTEGYKFRLESDIDLSNDAGLYIPYFAALEFDGNGHSISNFELDLPSISYMGLFGFIENGNIKDLGLLDINVLGDYYIGGLSGYNNGTVSDCYVTGKVSGDNYVGGLLGYNGRLVSTCCSNVTVNGNRIVGGFAGDNQDTISDCYSTGNVVGKDWVGGLVGSNHEDIKTTVIKCYSTGKVTGDDKVGGLIGGTFMGKVSKSFWDIDTSDQTESTGGVGLTTVTMKNMYYYKGAGWDFENTWCMVDKITYPFFFWQDVESPTANAGSDQAVDAGELLTFDGSSSYDDKGIVNYTWNFSDENSVFLYGIKPSYEFDHLGLYIVTLNVTDASGKWQKDSMTVNVIDLTLPLAEAGPDQSVGEGITVIFNGSRSSDNAGILNFTWSFNDGGLVTLYGINPSYQFRNVGIFIVILNVTDTADHWNTDSLTITVLDSTPPVANAGPDQSAGEGVIITFYGIGSSDNTEIINYTWTFFDEGLIRLFGINPTYQFNNPGVYNVTLNTTDGRGNWHTDTLTITVMDTTPPSADAGPDRGVDEDYAITFNGEESSDNVGVVNWTWTFKDGSKNITLYGLVPYYIFKEPGSYIVTLRITDVAGNWNTDSLKVTVRDITPPVANAGFNLTTEEGTMVNFNGSLSFDNAGIVNYTWTFSDGETDITLYGIQPNYTFNDQGVYTITLLVKDATDYWDEDSLIIQVNKAPASNVSTVHGKVTDEDGNPLEGVEVKITASDGRKYRATTDSNGSFSVEIPYGNFSWKVNRKGYKPLSGTSSTDELEEGFLDLKNAKFVKEDRNNVGLIFFIIVVILLLIAVSLILFFILRKKKKESEEATPVKEEDNVKMEKERGNEFLEMERQYGIQNSEKQENEISNKEIK